MTWQASGKPQWKAPEPRPRVLLVDDEPAVLDGLRRQLRRYFDVSTAVGGEAALELMENEAPFAAVLSDMRMPGLDGASFLAIVKERAPDTVRMLLTGQADLDSTVAAINDGQIYRFLNKPCAVDVVRDTLQDAVALHRQVSVERDVLEQTLHGAVQALLDVLALASPKAFSRAARVSELVTELAEATGVPLDWELGICGMLAELGAVTVPTTVLDKLDAGLLLNEDEQAMIDALPGITERLVAGIPRLEPLAAAIGQQRLRYDGRGRQPAQPSGESLPLAARLLRMAVDIDRMRAQRLPPGAILKRMGNDRGAYDPAMLELWEKAHVAEPAEGEPEPVSVEIEELRSGMVLAEDVFNSRGVVLIGRGASVTEAVLQRLRNHARHGEASGPIVVLIPKVPVS